MKSPIEISFAPKGLKSDWEFASDPLAGYLKKKVYKKRWEESSNMQTSDSDYHKSPWDKIVESEIKLTDIFGTSFTNGGWGIYNYDTLGKFDQMRCNPDCLICKQFFNFV